MVQMRKNSSNEQKIVLMSKKIVQMSQKKIVQLSKKIVQMTPKKVPMCRIKAQTSK